MKINPTFPTTRLSEPTRRAERDIYEGLAASTLPGRAIYEVKFTRKAKQIDFHRVG